MYNIVRVGDSFLSSVVVAFVSRTNKGKTEITAPSVPGRVQRLALFGSPILLEGEDAAAYDQLFARICSAVKPVDIIGEIFVADLMSLEWEVLRWRRLKSSLIQARGREVLQDFLKQQLKSNYALYKEHFQDYLAEILRNNLPKDQADSAEMLADECAPNDSDADDTLCNILRSIGLRDADTVLYEARANKAKDLVQDYVRREPNAVTLVDELLTDAGVSMDGLMARALAQKLNDIERIDRLTSIAESRRNASLHEIERRRAVLGETLRRSVQEIEDGEFEMIEPTPTQGENAA
jgi:hypothetical protein